MTAAGAEGFGCGRALGLQLRHQEGIDYLSFDLLEQTGAAKHLISTRLGGVSEGIYGTMNYSYNRGDDRRCVDENFRRTAALFGKGPEAFVCSDQIHTVNVRKVTRADAGKGVVCPKDYRDVDGLITDEPGLILATFYADCVPLLFVDPVRRAIGCSHSGWRGTVQEMGRVTVEKMVMEYGCRPEDIRAAIGPSICQECYEVSADVAEAFGALFSQERYRRIVGEEGCIAWEEIFYAQGRGDSGAPASGAVPTAIGFFPEEKYQLNLWKANEAILLAAGILPEHLAVTDVCTCCNPQVLFSHRASQGKRGNLGAFLMLEI